MIHIDPLKHRNAIQCEMGVVTLQGMLRQVLLAMGLASLLTVVVAAFAVLRPSPWYGARMLLPAVAVLLGHSVNAVTAGLTAALQELTEGAPPTSLAVEDELECTMWADVSSAHTLACFCTEKSHL